MVRYILFLILASFTLATAQNWEWQQYDGDYRNPTGFPGMPTCAGDFDGDGIDELLTISSSGWSCTSLDQDAEGYHWLPPISGAYDFTFYCRSITTFDVDEDGADEVIGIREISSDDTICACWKLVSTDPWTWERRDSLLFPWLSFENYWGLIWDGAFGDIDGDGKMNFLVETPMECICTAFEILEYDSTGLATPEYGYMDHFWRAHSYTFGDFDRDGVEELAVTADSFYTLDHTPFTLLFEVADGELIGPTVLEPQNPISAIVSGDFDGDGHEECITERWTEPREYKLVYYYSNLIAFWLADMTPFNGRVMGNILAVQGTPITDPVGFHYWEQHRAWGTLYGSVLKRFTENGWQYINHDLHGEGYMLTVGLCLTENEAYPDLIEVVRTQSGAEVIDRWRAIWSDRFGDGDFFYQPIECFSPRFTDNPDTLFSSPQFGNADLDSVPDLYVIAKPTGEPTRVMIFESDWNPPSTPLFQNQAGWVTGLPTGIEQIRVCDLDGNGISEIFCRQDSLHWSLYYLQGASWQDYSDILPDFESTDIGFADFDYDGDIDLFTDDDVWLSLSPSPAAESSILSPSSFILSAYPNPFNATTTIRFDLPTASRVVLDVFNINGQRVQSVTDKPYTAGTHTLTFDGTSLASGLYFAQLQYQNSVNTTKLMLIK